MLSSLPPEVAPHYAEPRRLFRPDDQLPPDFRSLNARYCEFRGPRKEYRAYFARKEVWPLWHLAVADEAVGCVAIA